MFFGAATPYAIFSTLSYTKSSKKTIPSQQTSFKTVLFARDAPLQNPTCEKTTKEQILMCFDAYEDPCFKTLFD